VYIPEDGILHNHHRENFKSYIALTGWACSGEVTCLLSGINWVLIAQKTTFFCHRRENLKSYIALTGWAM
jgi:hypothetical protein